MSLDFSGLNGFIATLAAVLGIPMSFFQIRKIVVEIRKLELESQALESKQTEKPRGKRTTTTSSEMYGHDPGQMLDNPRLVNLLLLTILDFLIAAFFLAVTNYGLSIVFVWGTWRPLIMALLSVVLLGPIVWTAWRIRRNMGKLSVEGQPAVSGKSGRSKSKK